MTRLEDETARVLREGIRRWLADDPAAKSSALRHEGVLAELGLAGLLVAEDLGGGGGTLADAVAVSEELGRGLAETSFLTSAVMAVTALMAAGTPTAREIATELAAGKATAQLLVPASWRSTDTSEIGPPPQIRALDSSGPALHDWTMGAVAAEGGRTRLVAVRRSHSGTLAWPPGSGQLVELAVDAGPVLRRALDAGRIALAAELNGSAARALDLVTAYAANRATFGRLIGSYQAYRHACAEHWISLQLNRALVRSAVHAYQTGDPETTRIAAAAAAGAAEGLRAMGEATILLHGGIGFTWEHQAQRHLRHANDAHAYLHGTMTQWDLARPRRRAREERSTQDAG
jgi:alkylation response protein AidB-like acyl-CoA dehydrogenase